MMMKPIIRLFMCTSPDQAVTSLTAVCHPWHAPNHPWGAKTLHLVFIELLALPEYLTSSSRNKSITDLNNFDSGSKQIPRFQTTNGTRILDIQTMRRRAISE